MPKSNQTSSGTLKTRDTGQFIDGSTKTGIFALIEQSITEFSGCQFVLNKQAKKIVKSYLN